MSVSLADSHRNLALDATGRCEVSAELAAKISQFKLPEPLGFGAVMAPIMYRSQYRNGVWNDGELLPYGPIPLDPAAKVLHYSQEIFEGMKAYRVGGGRPTLFRPLANWQRFNDSAQRLCMPELPSEIFMEGVTAISRSLTELIPTQAGQSLYLRPFMIGVDANLSLGASNDNDFYVIASPSEIYHNGDLRVFVEREGSRAAVGGTGNVKVGGNYAAALASGKKAVSGGFDQTLWLDPRENRYIEELSGMNVFAVVKGKLITPQLSGSILPGITRDSIITLVQAWGMDVGQQQIDIDELFGQLRSGDCSEVFACGTAATVSAFSCLADALGNRVELAPEHPIAERVRAGLIDIQEGRSSDEFSWRFLV
ncbi:branched-chain amino acid aminotransferase [Zhongshania sp.]|uniref:branched-chain amino acid aminotransferase n=1 Tax=Zhongshania sp. TaxID=1971902 RepID=UPI003561DC57